MVEEKLPIEHKRISKKDIREKVKSFLQEYHPEDTIPVPIEKIIEFKLGLNIVPLPDFRERYEVDGHLGKDMQDIFVDMEVYKRRPRRLRYTLAHEIGHYYIHTDLYKKKELFATEEEWKDFLRSFPAEEQQWFEWQAYEFGGQLLVPFHHLKKSFKEKVKLVKERGAKEQYLIEEFVTELLSREYNVSTDVIRKRIINEGMNR